jgi:dTDP-4-amino-4,6-dideoxygalactose transaminase
MTTADIVHRPIQFVDLAQQQARIRAQIDAAMANVLDHGHYILGPEVAQLEHELARFCGARFAVSCGSGTDALLMGLMAKCLAPGQAVIVPSFTFAATAEVVCLLGGIPVFADVREDTFTIDPPSVEHALATAHKSGLAVAGIISVDLFGNPCDYASIEAFARDNGLWLICDAAQSFGATYRGRRVGTIGDLTATSFFPAKPLGCYGDGGAIFTDDSETAEILRSLRVHGQGSNKYDNVRIGINGRLDTLQAAILLQKLSIFEEEITLRGRVARFYDEYLPSNIVRPSVQDGAVSAWAHYTTQLADRDRARQELHARGVPTMVYYPKPLHRQTAYRYFPCAGNGLPVSGKLSDRVLSLPMHPYLTPDEQQHIAGALKQCL